MPKFYVSNIIWDTDGETVDLPDTAVVEAEDDSEVLDVLSDEYGWLIESCTIEEMSEG